MRVGMITSYLSGGGAGLYARQLSDGLAAGGHSVHILTEAATQEPVLESSRVTIDTIQPLFSSLLIKLFPIDPKSFHRSLQFLRDYRPDVVHVHEAFRMSLGPILACQILRIPVVATIHTYWPICFLNRLCYRGPCACEGYDVKRCGGCLAHDFSIRSKIRIPPGLVETILKQLIRARRLILSHVHFAVPTPSIGEKLRTVGISKRKIKVIPLAIKTEEFEPCGGGAGTGLFSGSLVDEKTVLFVGRLHEIKGVEFLVRAFSTVSKEIPSARLIIVGEGPERRRLMQLSLDLGLRDFISFVGGVPRERLVPYYAAAKVCVIPSISEVCPYVALEAMAMRKPVVASGVGGLEDIVSEETGILVSPGNAKELAQAILVLLRTPDMAREKGIAGCRMITRNHTFHGMMAAILDLYRDIREGPS
jgi:glycosyltransferase involved in cell wall biosynthesis